MNSELKTSALQFSVPTSDFRHALPHGRATAPNLHARSAHEAYGARQPVFAEQHIGLDAPARRLGVDRQSERGERRARKLHTYEASAVALREARALHQRDEVGRDLFVARVLRAAAPVERRPFAVYGRRADGANRLARG